MTELQKARQRWLDAETRAINAEARCFELQKTVHELRQKLLIQATQHAVDCVASPWVALAAEIRSKQ
jgi:hypothetical protein